MGKSGAFTAVNASFRLAQAIVAERGDASSDLVITEADLERFADWHADSPIVSGVEYG